MLITKFLPSGTTQFLGRAALKLQKHTPEILTGLGIIGSIGSGVLLVRAGMKTPEVIETIRGNVDTVKEIHKEDLEKGEKTQSFTKDLAVAYTYGVKDLVKIYAPGVVLGAISISSIVGGHGILKKRNVAMAAAYKAVSASYEEYRDRVREALGEEKEGDIYHEVRQVEVTNEKGKTVLTPERIGGKSPYAKCFDEFSSNWDPVAEYNLLFLRNQQEYANQRLRARGHLFLNDVYEALGLPVTPAGQVVGWLRDSENGDGYVDFGLYDIESESARRFINGYESAVWLDFNVDGPIYEMI